MVTGINDPRNHDIANNAGFVKLLNCWIAAKRGDKVPTSSEWKVESGSFWWHYGYWGFLGFGNGAGGSAAFDSATHFLGSYTANVRYAGKKGDKGLYDIEVKNTSGWTSGTRTEGVPVAGWIIKQLKEAGYEVSLFSNHERGGARYSPSRGGNYVQFYRFQVEADPCVKCILP